MEGRGENFKIGGRVEMMAWWKAGGILNKGVETMQSLKAGTGRRQGVGRHGLRVC